MLFPPRYVSQFLNNSVKNNLQEGAVLKSLGDSYTGLTFLSVTGNRKATGEKKMECLTTPKSDISTWGKKIGV